MPIEPLRGPQSDALADGSEVIASGTIVGTPPIVRHEEGLRTAAQKPVTIDGPLTQSALITKIVFVFQLERIVRRLCVFAFDA
jgi:hypothetical protein